MGLFDFIFGSPEKKEKDLREKLAHVEGINRSSKAEIVKLREELSKLSEDKIEEKNNIQQSILDHEEAIRRSEKDIARMKAKLTKLKPAVNFS
tara:strand:- start:285 stop:563 length:279 start_codon:yes stop_codon:yes gene_type:complete